MIRRKLENVTWVRVVSGLVGLSQSSCGTDASACGSVLATESDLAPRLTDFQLNKQLDGDPWTLIFAATFEDSNGDLGNLGQVASIFRVNKPLP